MNILRCIFGLRRDPAARILARADQLHGIEEKLSFLEDARLLLDTEEPADFCSAAWRTWHERSCAVGCRITELRQALERAS